MQYEIFSHKVNVEGEIHETFGIAVTDSQENTYSFEDVTTFKSELEKFVAFLNEENVSLRCFKIFLGLFIENL